MSDEEDKEYEVTLTFTAKTSVMVTASSPEEAAYLAECIVHEEAGEDGILFYDKPYVHPEKIVREYHEPKPKVFKKKKKS